MTTERLPRVEAKFTVLAQEGGMRRRLRAIDLGRHTSIDIEVEDPSSGIRMWLRVVPVREEIVLDPAHDEIYIFNHANALFIERDGGRELPDKPLVDVWMNVNTQVQAGGTPAGTLKMWEYSLGSHQIGA